MPAVGEYREHVTVEGLFGVRITLSGHEDRRDDGEVSVRSILPEKPERLVRLMDSVLEVPALRDIEEGPDIVKSVIVMLRRRV